jgi:hypothetical protein
MPIYCVFGLTFASDFPFTYRLAPGDGEPEFTFTCVGDVPIAVDWQASTPLFISPYHTGAGESTLSVYGAGAYTVMHCADAADFYLFTDRILCRRLSNDAGVVETKFLSVVLAFWLERKGTVALHASAVALAGPACGAVAFLSHSGNGKSGLAAALVQAGNALLSDDIVPLALAGSTWLAQPGFATMRMWPDEAEFFLGDYASLPCVHPATTKRRVAIGAGAWGTFCPHAQPISGFFVPERRGPRGYGDDITITRIAPREVVIELVRYSFAARLAQATGLQPRRMQRFVDLAKCVPFYRLSYPSGFPHLADVGAAVRAAIDGERALLHEARV